MGTWWPPLQRHIGHRGAFLLLLALLDGLIGVSLLTLPATQQATVHTLLPLSWWAWGWVGTGALLAVYAFRRRDTLAFVWAAGFNTAWAASSAWAWLKFHQPQGWAGVAIWMAFSAMVLVVSSWQEDLPPGSDT